MDTYKCELNIPTQVQIGPIDHLDDTDPSVIRRQVTVFGLNIASIWGTSNVLYFDEPMPEDLAAQVHTAIQVAVPFELDKTIQISGRDFT